jgi:hypothetical protein
MANTKKNIKVRDLKPSKDAKGGGARLLGATTAGHETLGATTAGKQTLGSKDQHKHHGGGHNHN